MIAISIKQPYAEFIMGGIKKVENRIWRCAFKGVLLIHTSQKFDEQWHEKLCSIRAITEAKEYLNRKTIARQGNVEFPKGYIVGAVIMTGCDIWNNDYWCQYGLWFHRYQDAIRFKKPIKCKGRLKLFEPKIKLEDFAKDDLENLREVENLSTIYGFEKI